MAKKTHELGLALLDPGRFPSKKAVRTFVRSREYYTLFHACADTLLDEPRVIVPPDVKERARGISWYILEELRELAIVASQSGPVEVRAASTVPDDYSGLVRSLEALVHHQTIVGSECGLDAKLADSLPPLLRVLDGIHERRDEFLPAPSHVEAA